MRNWIVLTILGALSVIAGILALANPLAGSITATVLAGWAFLVIGCIEVVTAFSETGWGHRIWSMLLGLIAAFVGANLLGEPLAGMIQLTLVLGIMFLVSGIFKLLIGFRLPAGNLKWLALASGAVSLVLGAMILSNFPQSAATILGVLLGIELLSNGVAMIALSWAGKSATSA